MAEYVFIFQRIQEKRRFLGFYGLHATDLLNYKYKINY